MIKEPIFETDSLEQTCRARRLWRMGWAIDSMKWYERIWWAITGRHKFMTYEFWEKQKGRKNNES
jgi:hypothetical protein